MPPLSDSTFVAIIRRWNYMAFTKRVMSACKHTDLPLFVLHCTTSGDTGMIACDAFCAVAAQWRKMLRERARPLRVPAEEEDQSKLEAELQELEIRKFQLDADNAEIDSWDN